MVVPKLAARLLIALVAAASLAITASASAGENLAERNTRGQNAVATGGWLAKGGLRLKDERGTLFKFQALLVFPDGDIDGNGPQTPHDPDLRRPWVALVETSTDALGGNRTECVGFTNPSSARFENTREGEVPVLFADLTCDDARGFDFYRLEWQATEPLMFGPVRTVIPQGPYQAWFKSPYIYDKPHYAGGLEWTSFRYGWGAEAMFRICGYRAGRADCLIPQGQTVPWLPGAVVGGWNVIRSYASRLMYSECC